MRLVRYLAHCGVASRRGAAELVRQGLVKINGQICLNVASQIAPEDQVTLSGKLIRPPKTKTVLLLHKPSGFICSLRDPHHPQTVLHCLPPNLRAGLKPVGRLDKNTTGLLLLTDDGDLLNRLAHPRYGVEKTYRVLLAGSISETALETLRQGVQLDDALTAPARVHRLPFREARASRQNLSKNPSDLPQKTLLEITIHEGRKRQIRRMCEAVGHPVIRLERIRYGPLSLGNLKPGAHRRLSPGELAALQRAVGLP